MKNTKKIVCAILALIMVLTCFTPLQAERVSANSKREMAVKAYQKWLKKYESQYTDEQWENYEQNAENYKYCSSFAVIDMNGDKIPELVTKHCNGYMDWEIHVFTYKKGKVKALTKKGILVSSNMGGTAYPYFCSKNHLHIYHYYEMMGTDDTAYRLSKSGKLSEYLGYSWYWYDFDSKDSSQQHCVENGKEISVKQYEKLFKKCGAKDTSCWKANTRKERGKLTQK